MITGAGVSTNAGVPDFRSADTGIFGALRERFADRFPVVQNTPEVLLSRDFVIAYPDIWRNEIWPLVEGNVVSSECKPTTTHRFAAWLHQQGWLRRVYKQNIDGLHLHETLTNFPEEKVIECHGSLRNKQNPSLVLYGDQLPDIFFSSLRRDFDLKLSDKVDLILVLGTSLQVAPFCAVPNLAPRGATRVLVNRDLNECLMNDFSSPQNSFSSSIQLGGRKSVSLRSLWTDRKANRKWRQLLVESDCDEFVERFFDSSVCLQKGYHL